MPTLSTDIQISTILCWTNFLICFPASFFFADIGSGTYADSIHRISKLLFFQYQISFPVSTRVATDVIQSTISECTRRKRNESECVNRGIGESSSVVRMVVRRAEFCGMSLSTVGTL